MNNHEVIGNVATSETTGIGVVVMDGVVIMLDCVVVDGDTVSSVVVPVTKKSDAISLALLLVQAADHIRAR